MIEKGRLSNNVITENYAEVFEMAEPGDLFDILGLLPTASLEEVKIAHAVLVKVWDSGRFPPDQKRRAEFLGKRKEIDSAYLKLKRFFESSGNGTASRNGGGGRDKIGAVDKAGEKAAAPEGSRSICRVCGQVSSSGDERCRIHCPSCGALNYLESWKDYYKGVCAECDSPLRLAAKLGPATKRKIACRVLAAVALAGCLLGIFVYGGDIFEARSQRKFPLPHSCAVPEMMGPLTPGEESVKKFPLPPVSSPPVKPAAPAPSAAPEVSPSQAVSAPKPQPPQTTVRPPENKPAEAGEVAPGRQGAGFHERYDQLIERILRKKSSLEKTEGILEIPLPGSAGEHE